jgi:hypothetical protein
MVADPNFPTGELKIPVPTGVQQYRIRARDVLGVVPVMKDTNKQNVKQRENALNALTNEQKTMNTILPLVRVNGIKRWARKSLLQQTGTFILQRIQQRDLTLQNTFAYDHFLPDENASIEVEDDSTTGESDEVVEQEPEFHIIDDDSEDEPEEMDRRQRGPAISISSDEVTPGASRAPVNARPLGLPPVNVEELFDTGIAEGMRDAEDPRWAPHRARLAESRAELVEMQNQLAEYQAQDAARAPAEAPVTAGPPNAAPNIAEELNLDIVRDPEDTRYAEVLARLAQSDARLDEHHARLNAIEAMRINASLYGAPASFQRDLDNALTELPRMMALWQQQEEINLFDRLWVSREDERAQALALSMEPGHFDMVVINVPNPSFEDDLRHRMESCRAATARLRMMMPSFMTNDPTYRDTLLMIDRNTQAMDHWNLAREWNDLLEQAKQWSAQRREARRQQQQRHG